MIEAIPGKFTCSGCGQEITVQRSTGWRPIDTAPKDGTPILGYSADGSYTVVRWRESVGYHYARPSWSACSGGHPVYPDSDLDDQDQPTHWMPLPEPPTHWMPLPEPPKTVREQADSNASPTSNRSEARK